MPDMNHLQYLLSSDGLACVPSAIKMLALMQLAERPSQWIARYYNERLRVVEAFIDPLCQIDHTAQHAAFAELCARMDGSSPDEIFAFEAHPREHKNDLQRLYSAAIRWVLSDLMEETPEDLVVELRHETAERLRYIERPRLATELWEDWLGLIIDDYGLDCDFTQPDELSGAMADWQHLHRKLKESALRNQDPVVRLRIVTSLANALAFTRRAGVMHEDPFAVKLVEAWLGFFPKAYESRVASELMLEQTPLANCNAPFEEALLMASWGQSLGWIDESVRGKRCTINLLTAWSEIPEVAYDAQTSEPLTLALPQSKIGQIDHPDAEATFVGILGDALRFGKPTRTQEQRVNQTATPEAAGESSDATAASDKYRPPELFSDGGVLSATEPGKQELYAVDPMTRQALNLMEGWAGFGPQIYDANHLLAFKHTLQRSRFGQIRGADAKANYLMRLSETLRIAAWRGPHHGACPILAFLNLSLKQIDDLDQASLIKELSGGPLSEITVSQVRANLLFTLANCLRQVDEIGARSSVRILLAYLRIPTELSDDLAAMQDQLCRVVDESTELAGVDLPTKARFVETIAKGLRVLPGGGDEVAATLMETTLGIRRPQSVEDVDACYHSSGFESRFPTIELQSMLLTQLAECWETLGDSLLRCGAELIAKWVGWERSTFESLSHDGVVEHLQSGRFAELGGANACMVLTRVAKQWAQADAPGLSVKLHAAVMRMPVENLSAASQELLNETICRFGNTTNQIVFVISFAEALSKLGDEGRLTALKLIETVSGVPIERFPDSKTFKGATLATRLQCVQIGLSCLEKASVKAFATSDQLVEFVRKSVGSFVKFEERSDFLQRIRQFLPQVQDVALAYARVSPDATSVEQQLLAWTETFENRLIVEEFLGTETIPMFSQDEGYTQPTEDCSALRGSWGESAIRPRYEAFIGNATIERNESVSASIDGKPHSDSVAREALTLVRRRRTTEHFSRLQELLKNPIDLTRASPTGAIWVRTLFDSDGQLHSWAWRNSLNGLKLIARKNSSVGSRRRLEIANLQFDAEVELVWNRCREIVTSADLGRVLRLLRQAVNGESTVLNAADQSLERMQEQNYDLEHFPRCIVFLSIMRDVIREAMSSGDDAILDPVRDALQVVQAVKEARPTVALEYWRRDSLNAATDRQIAAVDGEFNLTDLLGCVDEDELTESDLVFQVQGPLLAAPLAWSTFHGKPLFHAVRSTSVSLSGLLRQVAEEVAVSHSDVPETRAILSVTWEAPDKENNRKTEGLAYLECGLREISGQRKPTNWRFFGVGDEPIASHSSIYHAMTSAERRYSIVAIGAHGDEEQVGIRLADSEPWTGKGVPLGDVDFLVLASCAMGHMLQYPDRNAEGFLTQLFTQGARSVLAAKWRIADRETARFVKRVVQRYMELVDGEPTGQCLCARAMNLAYRDFSASAEVTETAEVTKHLMSAFDSFGRG